jgi:DNA-binding PadR family transcriptional regulator
MLPRLGDHIEGTSAIPTDTEASGWAELARLRRELDDAKKIIQMLQMMIAENAQRKDERVSEPLWK